MMRKIILTLLLSMVLITLAAAQTVDATASWTAPTEGSPVDHYVLQLSENGGPFYTVSDTITTTSFDVQLENLTTYVARVAGVDAQDRQGPWSEPSEPYTPDLGPPGAPTQPIIVEP